MQKVILGMSGGVDSSVAAYLLQKQGYEVIGITFKFIDDFDYTDALNVAKKLNIEHHVIDYRKEFKEQVIDKFISDYKRGITPNPCVLCNRDVKIKFLYEEMKKLNCDYISTGHYAIIKDGRLFKSSNEKKDQSYFMCEVNKEILNKLLLPLEGMEKEHVREIAEFIGLDVYNKKDSFDVCFIKKTFNEYISDAIKQEVGDVIDVSSNKTIGKHKGLAHYTIGQRRGLDIGGYENRMFVVGKNIEKNILYVCTTNYDYLYSDSCLLENVNIIGNLQNECNAKFRYHQADIPVSIELLENNEMLVNYKEPVKSVTPGQACALYVNDEVIAGGIIKEVRKNNEKIWYL